MEGEEKERKVVEKLERKTKGKKTKNKVGDEICCRRMKKGESRRVQRGEWLLLQRWSHCNTLLHS